MFTSNSQFTTRLLVGLLLGLFAVPPQAQASAKPALLVQISLVSNSTCSLGEPIVLKYQIRNTTSERAETYMGQDQTGWVTETLADTHGRTFSIKAGQPWRPKGGAHIDGPSVFPRSSATGYVVFNPWAVIPTAGRYTVTVHTRLPYAREAQGETLPPSRYAPPANAAVNDFTFALTVTPHASQTLQHAAETLRQEASTAKMQDWSAAAAEALFSMPEADVLPVWQEMISDPTTPRYALGSRRTSLFACTPSPPPIWSRKCAGNPLDL